MRDQQDRVIVGGESITPTSVSESVVNHGVFSGGAKEFNAAAGGGHTISISGNLVMSVAGLPAGRLSHISIKLTVTANTPDVTPPDRFTVRNGSLDNLVTGVHLLELVSFDGVSGYIFMDNAS